jgi:hypothetical protein
MRLSITTLQFGLTLEQANRVPIKRETRKAEAKEERRKLRERFRL